MDYGRLEFQNLTAAFQSILAPFNSMQNASVVLQFSWEVFVVRLTNPIRMAVCTRGLPTYLRGCHRSPVLDVTYTYFCTLKKEFEKCLLDIEASKFLYSVL